MKYNYVSLFYVFTYALFGDCHVSNYMRSSEKMSEL
jgi:hypothetical protein